MAGGSRRNADAALIMALAGGATMQDAARRAGISERTCYRRMQDGDFQKLVSAARADMVTRAVARLARMSATATDTLEGLLGASTPATVRLGAARSVLELGSRLRESEELERRICLLYTSDAADDLLCVDLGGRRI